MTSPALRPLSIGEILDQSFGVYRRQFGPLVFIAVVCLALPFVINAFLQLSGGYIALLSGDRVQSMALLLVYFLGAVLLNMVGIAATTEVISSSYLGHAIRAGEALRRAVGRLPSLVALGIVSTAVMLAAAAAVAWGGYFLLKGVSARAAATVAVLGGFFTVMTLALALLLGPSALVLEPGIGAVGAMRRSWTLTRGYRLRLLLLGIVVVVLAFIAVMGVGVVLGIVGAMLGGLRAGASPEAGAGATGFLITTAVVTGLIQLMLFPLFYAILTVTYYDLRVRKEAFDLEMLASALQQPA